MFSLAATLLTLTPSVDFLDTVELSLVVEVPSGYSVDEKELTENLLDYGEVPIEAFKLQSTTKAVTEGGVEFHYYLEPALAGHHFLAFRKIRLIPNSAERPDINLSSNAVKITVLSPDSTLSLPIAKVIPLQERAGLELSLENERELKRQAALQPQINRKIFSERLFPWHYFILYPLLLTFAFVLSRIKREVKSTKTPGERAQQRLDALHQEDFHRFYTEITAILREYMEVKYGFFAQEMTTEQFMKEILEKDFFSLERAQSLILLLQYADQIKFAKATPSLEANQQALLYAQQFIEQAEKT